MSNTSLVCAALALGLLVGCGNSVTDTAASGAGGASGATGGGSGTGKSTSGHSSGTGGSNAKASSSNSGSGTGKGGSNATSGGKTTGSNAGGGNAGGGSTNGAGGAAAQCPTQEPTAFMQCTDIGETCTYSGDQCQCVGRGGFGGWTCTACPATKPANGDTCTSGLGNLQSCNYGSDQCSCTNNQWACGSCPSTEPTDGATCTGSLQCTFGGTDCRCVSSFTGGASAWRCFGNAQGAGVGGGFAGAVGAGGGFVGAGGGATFSAGVGAGFAAGAGGGNANGCPSSQPASGDACMLSRMTTCDYGNHACVCINGGFACN